MYQTITTLIVVTLMFGSANAATCKGPRTVCTDKDNNQSYQFNDTYYQKWKDAGIGSQCADYACTGSNGDGSLESNLITYCNKDPAFSPDAINELAQHSKGAHDTALCLCKKGGHCQKTDNPSYHYLKYK